MEDLKLARWVSRTNALFCVAILCTLVGGHHLQKTGVAQPGVVSAVAPVFPALAAAARVTGEVTVDVTIDASGSVSAAQAQGHPLLTATSEAAAKRWQFSSDEGNGTARTARLVFSFSALEEELPEDLVTPIFRPPYRVEVIHNRHITY